MTTPLVVDLDGTLLQSDMLAESGLAFVKRRPLAAPRLLLWLLESKAMLKEKLARETSIDVTCLPYNVQLLEWLRHEKSQGREIVLATATHLLLAERIADHLQLFDKVIATSEGINLSRQAKCDALVAAYGEQGFDYAGNSLDDLPVWAKARAAIVVNPERGVESAARRQGNVDRVLPGQPAGLRVWARALRFHQWLKNLLIFVPLLASHQFTNPDQVLRGIVAFVLFGMCASSVYLLNDMFDLEDDRHHPTKRNRPLASGALRIKEGLLVCAGLLAGAFGIAAWLMPWMFVASLGAYYALTLAYSLVLKQVMLVDVVVLAMLYTQRIIAGTFVFATAPTFWLLAFSMFIFLSLALVKRYAELRDARSKGKKGKARGRGYFPDDLEMISSLGAAAGYISILVLALYIQDQRTVALYHHPHVIWFACPLLLYWISRIWLLTHRGLMNDDPVVFAVKDRASLAVGALFVTIFWLAR
jgi:4-hydroxybenzoate polyprenyltransferase/phosphoserine phosphatase